MSNADSDADAFRSHHDLGGVARFMCTSIDTEPHGLSGFDQRVDALRQLLADRGLMSVDELRRGIEAIPEEQYHALSYYGRWIRSIAATLIRHGVIDETELRALLSHMRAAR